MEEEKTGKTHLSAKQELEGGEGLQQDYIESEALMRKASRVNTVLSMRSGGRQTRNQHCVNSSPTDLKRARREGSAPRSKPS